MPDLLTIAATCLRECNPGSRRHFSPLWSHSRALPRGSALDPTSPRRVSPSPRDLRASIQLPAGDGGIERLPRQERHVRQSPRQLLSGLRRSQRAGPRSAHPRHQCWQGQGRGGAKLRAAFAPSPPSIWRRTMGSVGPTIARNWSWNCRHACLPPRDAAHSSRSLRIISLPSV